jgi:hypothetical protein
MKRVIVDYKKLNPEILSLLAQTYPDGFDDEELIRFQNSSGEVYYCAELRTADVVYLVKVNSKLDQTIKQYLADDEEEDEEEDYERDIEDLDAVEES